jgi:hypothetical protein
MSRRRLPQIRLRLNFASVVALLALFVAIGGTSLGAPVEHAAKHGLSKVARALKLSKSADSRSRKALRSATQAKLLAQQALAKAAIPGPPGPGGTNGFPGTNGSALGYARLEYCATSCEDFTGPGWFAPDSTNSPGLDNSVNFSEGDVPGVFCFHKLAFTVHSVSASLSPGTDSSGRSLQVWAGAAGQPPHCAADGLAANSAAVYVVDSGGVLTPLGQNAQVYVTFN